MAEEAKANSTEGSQEKNEEAPSPPVKEMRAIVLTGFGGLKQVKLLKKPEVSAKEGEVLIRVKACGLNFTDLMVRQGTLDNPPKTPIILGFECSGVVEALGETVTDFKVGDKVVAFTEYNAWAELVAVPTMYVYKMPDGMNFQDAAAMLMNYVTAYILLFELGNLQKGKSVLVHSAGGGVGHAISQLCRTVEDVTVYGTASYHKHDAIKNDFTQVIDRVVDYVQEVRKLSPEGIDIVLDSLCGEDVNRGYSLLKPMGKYILYGTSNIVTGETKSFFGFAKSWWQVDKVSPLKLYDDNKCIAGFTFRHLLFRQGRHEYVRSIVEKLFKLYKEGKIKQLIDSTYAYEDVGEAMQKMHDRKNVGKIILDPSLQPKPKPVQQGKKSDAESSNAGSNGDKEQDSKDGGSQAVKQ